MIPDFPNFKKIELSDKEEVEKYTNKYPPYSDFNFVSMWSWDTEGKMRISQLNNNLIVLFNDYITGEPFYSFLGKNMVNETIEQLLLLSKKEGINPKLKLIPEIVLDNIDKNLFSIKEDRDNFDYIILIDKLKAHDGKERKLSTRRKFINKLKNSPDVFLKPIDITKPEISDRILDLSFIWEKDSGMNENEVKHLSAALKKSLLFSHEKTFAVGVFIKNNLVGYSLNEILPNGYALGNFQQADLNSSPGIYALLMEEVAENLDKLGCKYLNLEQDLGIKGLNKWKMSYNPAFFLKKFIITDNQLFAKKNY